MKTTHSTNADEQKEVIDIDEYRAKMKAFITDVDTVHLSFEDEKHLASMLTAHMKELHEIIKKSDRSQFLRQVVVKTAFSNCEAFISVMKKIVLKSEIAYDPRLTEEEKQFLRGVVLKERNGILVEETARISLIDDVTKFGKLLAKQNDVDFRLKKEELGWDQFQKAIKVRDRLTHPKDISGMNVSDEELKNAIQGTGWITNSLFEFNSLRQKVRRQKNDVLTQQLISEMQELGLHEQEIRDFVERFDPRFDIDTALKTP